MKFSEIEYIQIDFEDIKKFFTDYLDVMFEKYEASTSRVALYIKDIIDMDSWYEVVVGGCLFV